ncbi:hypothetical protein TCE0_033r09705 [Talaromyces pinophilus]|uniref:Uncharacterized protein n=1 Tax=Talaromyces pinophilus TaxID=128442 RepID=A0A6V8HK81_TALPI|nr:hypothetical protein TCE0_033r09705 [Talaromyces pinophilus]
MRRGDASGLRSRGEEQKPAASKARNDPRQKDTARGRMPLIGGCLHFPQSRRHRNQTRSVTNCVRLLHPPLPLPNAHSNLILLNCELTPRLVAKFTHTVFLLILLQLNTLVHSIRIFSF